MDVRIPSNKDISPRILCLCLDPGGHGTCLFNLKGKFDLQARLFLKHLDDLSWRLVVKSCIDYKVSGFDYTCRSNEQKQNTQNK